MPVSQLPRVEGGEVAGWEQPPAEARQQFRSLINLAALSQSDVRVYVRLLEPMHRRPSAVPVSLPNYPR